MQSRIIQVNSSLSPVHNTDMESATESVQLIQEGFGPYQLRPNPVAILRLSLGTAAAISTALLIPDVFALLPSTPSAFALTCKAIGLWAYASVLWTTGFLCILHLVRIFGGGIVLDSNGLKLGRLEKKIPWSSIQAVVIAERKLFSKVFFIPAYQMTIHLLKPNGKRTAKQLASFMYLPEEFYSLFFYISEMSTGARPACVDAFVFRDASNPELRKIAEEGRFKRILLTAIITFGLFSFLARKAAVNYTFNMGNREFRNAQYDKAITYYSTASAIDFTFAPAWDRMARSEFRQGDIDSAEEHWKTALKWKPDFVESKLSLSTVCILKGQFEQADELITKAGKLAPYDEAAYINRAQLDALTGKNRQAIHSLEQFVHQEQGREQAIGILARCYMREGQLNKAQELFNSNPSLLHNPYTRPYCTMVLGELDLCNGKIADARALFNTIRLNANDQPDLMIDIAKVNIADGNFAAAERHLTAASKINPGSPWVDLTRAELVVKANQSKVNEELPSARQSSDYWLSKAMSFRYKDPCLLAACAQFLESSNQHQRAKEVARRVLEIDPDNLIAQKIASREKEESRND